MFRQIYHVGLTVSDLDRSIDFYRDVLGLTFVGEILMEGAETEAIFHKKGCKARVAYLNGSEESGMPPVELIQFMDESIEHCQMDLFRTGISELCFLTKDANETYEKLVSQGVECLSEPQEFDFSKNGFGRSKAFYLKDPDGIILEAMQPISE